MELVINARVALMTRTARGWPPALWAAAGGRPWPPACCCVRPGAP